MSAEFCPSITQPVVPKTGHAKEEPKIQMHERTGAWLGWQCRTWPSPALSLSGNGGMVSKLDCLDSQSVVRYLLQGFAGDSPKKAPQTDRYKREFAQWARQHSQRKVRFWHRKMWSDESWLCIYHVDGRIRVWRRHGKDYNQNCVQPRAQALGGSVMVSGMVSYEHKTPLSTVHGNLSATRCRDEILDITARPHSQQFQAEQPIIMDDNAVLIGHALWTLIKCGTTSITCGPFY